MMAPLFTVLGASGYIGSRLVTNLCSLNNTVWAPTRDDPSILNRPLGHLLYCVGLTGNFRSRPFDAIDAHITLLAQLLKYANFSSLLYLSSTRVYLGSERTDEDAPLTINLSDSSNLYNLTKLTGESLCHNSGRKNVRVARLSNVVGPGMDPASGNFIATLLSEARSGHVLLQSDPKSMKDYIHIDDVVNWLPRIALEGRANSYNVASGIQTTHEQWLQWITTATGCTKAIKSGAPLHQFQKINVDRLRREFRVEAKSISDWLNTPPNVTIK